MSEAVPIRQETAHSGHLKIELADCRVFLSHAGETGFADAAQLQRA
jgi:hypothetical protein